MDLHAIIQSVSGGSFTLGTINGLMISTPEADLYLDDIVLSGGELEKAYQLVPGAALAGTLAMQNANGAKTYFQYNDLGTVLAQTDGSAAQTGLWVPDFEGNYRYASTGSPARPALRLTGKPYDPAAALYYFGARWLDAERGRWVSEEPLGLDGPNLYHFLKNHFNGHFDPDGLESEELTGEDSQKNNWNSSYENGTGAGLFDNIYQTINSTINDAINSVKSFFGFDGGNRPGPHTAELASALLAGAELGSIKVAGTACKVEEIEEGATLVKNAVRNKPGSLGKLKGTDALRRENKKAGNAAKKFKLTNDQKKHAEITGQRYDFHEIMRIAEEIKKVHIRKKYFMELGLSKIAFYQTIQYLVGESAWSFTAGKGTGSVVCFEFGEKIRRNRPVKNPILTETQRLYEGTYSLMLWGPWRLVRKSSILCGSSDANEQGGIMLMGLQEVVHKTIHKIELIDPLCDLRISYDGDIKLETFSDSAEAEYEAYTFFFPDKTYTVKSNQTITIGARNRV